MNKGKVKAALRLITNQEKRGVLPLDSQIQVSQIQVGETTTKASMISCLRSTLQQKP